MNKTTRLRIILAVVGALVGLWLSPDRGALAAFWGGIDPTVQTLLYVLIGALLGVATEGAAWGGATRRCSARSHADDEPS